MENSNNFREAVNLLLIANQQVDLASKKHSVFSNQNYSSEARAFINTTKQTIDIIQGADQAGSVSYDQSNIPQWSTGVRADGGGYYHVGLEYMPCQGYRCGIMRIFRLRYNDNNQVTNRVAYMIVVKDTDVSVKKFTGSDALSCNSTPDWDSRL